MNKYITTVVVLIIIYYLILSCNPMNLHKGSKLDTMNYISEYTMPFIIYNKGINLHNLKYPLIFKPVLCQGSGRSVKLIKNYNEAFEYVANVNDKIIIQDYHPGPYEIGILYERNPFSKNGNIVSIVERNYKNTDLKTIWGSKIWDNDRNKKYNNMFIDRPDLITSQLTKKIDTITKLIPEMYVCRYDIRYDNDEDIKKGKNFSILEVNGTMGGDLRVYDSNTYYYFGRWLCSRIFIGFCNLLKLNSNNIFEVIKSTPTRIKKAARCSDHEKIFEWVHT